MKKIGRKHRPFYRICAVDSRSPRDGKIIEELGTYDPKVPDVDARVVMNHDRLTYWLGVGAKPSEHVAVFIKKYGPKGIRLKEQEDARARLSMPKIVPPAPEQIVVAKKAAPAEEAAAEAPAETAAE